MTPPHERLAQLERELKSNLASPRPDTLNFLNEALNRLREIPFSIEPARRVECLLSIAQQFYHQGQSVFSGVEPAALAVMLAADLGDPALHRKALTFQGIILSQTNNPGDALLSLAEALRLAEESARRHWHRRRLEQFGRGILRSRALLRCARVLRAGVSPRCVIVPRTHNMFALVALANAAICCLHISAHHEKGIEKIAKRLR